MDNFIDSVDITNFKSIRRAGIEDCRRINLFIGRPNVGKSNLLEALSLFSIPYMQYNENPLLKQFVRAETDSELFFDGNMDTPISIDTPLYSLVIEKEHKGIMVNITDKRKCGEKEKIYMEELKSNQVYFHLDDIPFKAYHFPEEFRKKNKLENFLLPPEGDNLMDALRLLSGIKGELSAILNSYGLGYVFDMNSREIKIMRQKKTSEIFLIPFNSIADSLKRLIFYKTAIESNKNSILIFEEPEAHSYPPYISNITQSIIASETNQFFLTTHSPYVVNDLLECNTNELSIYLVDLKNGETIVKRVSDNQMQEIYDSGADLFFNTETFI
jgi:AAA15 family ATPase/GTPase